MSRIVLALMSLLLTGRAIADDRLLFESPVQIQAGGEPIDVLREGHSAPFYGDFDGDGIRDLLVGQYFEGRLRMYRNHGTNTKPEFRDYRWFEAGGKLATVPTECCIGFTPQLVDLNADGRTDVLSGSFPGEVYWFPRQADGRFAGGEILKDAKGENLNVGSAAATFAADWDSDGDYDLIIGTLTSEVYFVPNLGDAETPVFGKPERLSAAGQAISIESGDAAPVVADWNSDGRPDLIVGAENGSVVWFRNTGEAGAPKLEAPQPLIPKSPAGWKEDSGLKPGEWGLRVKPCIVDWNGDGRLDLLLGDSCGGFYGKPQQTKHEKTQEDTATRTVRDLRTKWAQTFQQYRGLKAAGADPEELEILQQRLVRYKKEIASAQSVLGRYQSTSQSHGFVWLFLQKANEK